MLALNPRQYNHEESESERKATAVLNFSLNLFLCDDISPCFLCVLLPYHKVLFTVLKMC